ncbi:spore coat protein [Bacillus sp. FJAT-27251]|uniref:spore coat protein n=1 Tax=Bacillus sp. FJAT-27251 TaxID=1684142 RepID=UPI0006A79B7A|nr:spore coat protein [Bacillus sp. FJAT-27251]
MYGQQSQQQNQQMNDQAIATEFLLSSKSAILGYAAAITETATPELKSTLRDQLNRAIYAHDQISKYMISKGYYHPHDIDEQIRVDLQATQSTLGLTH